MSTERYKTKLDKWMIKQLLNLVLAKYRDLSMARRSIIICFCCRHRQIIDLLATDKSRCFAQPRPIIDYYTSDSPWKIWLVKSIQSIHNSLWTWHDKINGISAADTTFILSSSTSAWLLCYGYYAMVTMLWLLWSVLLRNKMAEGFASEDEFCAKWIIKQLLNSVFA